jgi:hypothetical protein
LLARAHWGMHGLLTQYSAGPSTHALRSPRAHRRTAQAAGSSSRPLPSHPLPSTLPLPPPPPPATAKLHAKTPPTAGKWGPPHSPAQPTRD